MSEDLKKLARELRKLESRKTVEILEKVSQAAKESRELLRKPATQDRDRRTKDAIETTGDLRRRVG